MHGLSSLGIFLKAKLGGGPVRSFMPCHHLKGGSFRTRLLRTFEALSDFRVAKHLHQLALPEDSPSAFAPATPAFRPDLPQLN
jgi:hypothetical protein